MWKLGYEDAVQFKPSMYEDGPVSIIGIAAYDYRQGYKAGNRDRIWANGNRPPQAN
jgi:hypothetical protein